MPESFNAGDIVELKSGGPKMTVKSLDTYHGQYVCQWFGGKKLEQGQFAPESLKRAAPDGD